MEPLKKILAEYNEKLKHITMWSDESKYNDEVSKINNTFFQALDKFDSLREAYEVIKSIPVTILTDMTENKYKKLFDYAAEKLSTKNLDSTVKFFSKSVDDLIGSMQNEWIKYITESTANVFDKLNILLMVSDDKKTIESLLYPIKSMRSWPITHSKYDKYKKSYDDAISRMNEIKFDSDIENFLNKIKDKTATLADLNTKILEWIDAENLRDKIKLLII